MPELPEVQTTVTGLSRSIVGLTIADVWTNYNSPYFKGSETIKDPVYFVHFKKAVLGRTVTSVTRRAKNILIHLDSGEVILIHMKMTGHIIIGRYDFDPRAKKDPWTPAQDEREALHDPFNRYIRFVMTFNDKSQLVLSDMRKFAKVALISERDAANGFENSSHISDIGPEPLQEDFTFTLFKERISKKPNGKIKTVLMDQTLIAGIGNIYSDEALWRAGIHSEERVSNITDPLLKKLYHAALAVLRKGIDFGGDSMSDYRNIDGERGKFQEQHQAYRKTGQPCAKPGCSGIMLRKVVGGRSAHFCPVHQKLSSKR